MTPRRRHTHAPHPAPAVAGNGVLKQGAFSREQARAVVYEAAQRLAGHGFMVHHKKTRIVTPGARKIVLGLLVDGSRPRLLPEFKRRIEVDDVGVTAGAV
jgi:hypothetical protein